MNHLWFFTVIYEKINNKLHQKMNSLIISLVNEKAHIKPNLNLGRIFFQENYDTKLELF